MFFNINYIILVRQLALLTLNNKKIPRRILFVKREYSLQLEIALVKTAYSRNETCAQLRYLFIFNSILIRDQNRCN